jgi:hypothetical protein
VSKELCLSISESRRLLEEAVEALGADQFDLTYVVKQLDAEGNWRLLHYKTKPQGPRMLHSVKRRTDTSSIYTVEQTMRRLRIEEASVSGGLYHNGAANIAPLAQAVRTVFLHQRSPRAPVKEPAVVKKPDLGKQTSTVPAKKADVVPTAPKAQSFFKPLTNMSHDAQNLPPKVKFEAAATDKLSSLKRKSTPHPAKSVGKVDCLADIMKSNLYTVEEDDSMDVEPAPTHAAKRKHSPDTSSIKRPKTDLVQSTRCIEPMDEGPRYKTVKKMQTRTYLNEKGRLGKSYAVTEDLMVEVKEEVVHKPQPQLTSQGKTKTGTQTSLG